MFLVLFFHCFLFFQLSFGIIIFSLTFLALVFHQFLHLIMFEFLFYFHSKNTEPLILFKPITSFFLLNFYILLFRFVMKEPESIFSMLVNLSKHFLFNFAALFQCLLILGTVFHLIFLRYQTEKFSSMAVVFWIPNSCGFDCVPEKIVFAFSMNGSNKSSYLLFLAVVLKSIE